MKTILISLFVVFSLAANAQKLDPSKIATDICNDLENLESEITIEQASDAFSKYLNSAYHEDDSVYFNQVANNVYQHLLDKCYKYSIFSSSYEDFFTTMFSKFEGTSLPNLELKNLEGQNTKISNFDANTLIIDIWATWCGPCVSHIGDQEIVYRRLKEKFGSSVEWINVSVDSDFTKWQNFLHTRGKPGQNLIGNQDMIADQLSIARYPTYILVDRNLKILGFEVADLGWPSTETMEYLVYQANAGISASDAFRKIMIPGTDQFTSEYLNWRSSYYTE